MREFTARWTARQVESVEAEVAQEKAASLRRSWERLERTLQALRAEDRRARMGQSSTTESANAREELVWAAAEALWYYVVQREACGLRDTEQVMRELDVPLELRIRMGVRRAGPGAAKRETR